MRLDLDGNKIYHFDFEFMVNLGCSLESRVRCGIVTEKDADSMWREYMHKRNAHKRNRLVGEKIGGGLIVVEDTSFRTILVEDSDGRIRNISITDGSFSGGPIAEIAYRGVY